MTSCVRRSSRSASTKARSATIAVARRSCGASRSARSSARHLIIRTGALALAVAARHSDGANRASSPSTEPGPRVAMIRPRLSDIDRPFEDRRNAVGGIAFLEDRRARRSDADRDFSVELVQIVIDHEPKRTRQLESLLVAPHPSAVSVTVDGLVRAILRGSCDFEAPHASTGVTHRLRAVVVAAKQRTVGS